MGLEPAKVIDSTESAADPMTRAQRTAGGAQPGQLFRVRRLET